MSKEEQQQPKGNNFNLKTLNLLNTKIHEHKGIKREPDVHNNEYDVSTSPLLIDFIVRNEKKNEPAVYLYTETKPDANNDTSNVQRNYCQVFVYMRKIKIIIKMHSLIITQKAINGVVLLLYLPSHMQLCALNN